MTVLKISNEGLMDVNELILMGCSSKTGEDTIGKFGTGLKYAIAVLTRNDIDFDIYIGEKKVKLQKEPIFIRDREFEQIIIDYNKTSITTNLGVEWEVWQGVREFIANALDMNGDFVVTDTFTLESNRTTIVFNDVSQVEDCLGHFEFDEWEEVESGHFFKRLDSPRRARVFKEGFLVYEAEDNSSFDYRIDSLGINEARMAENRWDVQRGIAKIMSLMEKEDVQTIVENEEVGHGIFFGSDELSDGWDDIERKDVKGEGYSLDDAITKRKAEVKGEDEIRLYHQGDTYVDKNDEVEPGVFYQDGKSDNGTLADFDPKTNDIYIWEGEFSREGEDTRDELDEIRDIVLANQIVLDNKLDSALDAILYIKKTQGLN